MGSEKRKHIVFDIVGTCVSYDAFFDALEERLGNKLRSHSIPPRLLGMLWLADTERECMFLRASGRSGRFMELLKPFIYRFLAMSGIESPKAFCSDEDAEYIASSYGRLRARNGVHECMQKLRQAGFEVWACTSGDRVRVQKYLEEGGIEIPNDRFVPCEEIRGGAVTKPQLGVYEFMLSKFPDADEKWFAACHMWDTTAARKCGFKAAWCSAWEKEAVTEAFGEVEVMAENLVTMAEKIITASAG
ncbi:uncharacterized protein MYCFIDRAFT_34313 [Pseudocercospora fijiensis CIRAD86]|uniref:2-haloalkanoic acid dehalogenase n=1 Tax=Pseudocercospora fijiensis (strain CIRAD86) TaxID=383855 RepID=M3A3S0_PSEFD|nr:uncharacterized protein MYCFIDRAFT_34313 [Pseudocercospora fijiensis CIRAD86]EME79256.1 hypothetical protein MYCFIDRAFT_34313 [Pseudocercospora fijiensis CIRAD86]